MMWHSSVIDDIKARVSVRDLATEAGAVFRRDSSACPLHGGDNRTAFHLRDEDTYWHCFTKCPERQNDGDVIDFYQHWKGVDYVTAVRELARRAHVELEAKPSRSSSRSAQPHQRPESLESPPPVLWQERGLAFVEWAHEQLLQDEVGRSYLQGRGLTMDTIRQWKLGWNPQMWKRAANTWGLKSKDPIWLHPGIVIPHMDADGTLWGIKIRVFKGGKPVSDKGGKYRGPRGQNARGMLFGEPSLSGMPVLILVEGEFDSLLAWQEAADFCDVGTMAGARKRLHTMALATVVQYPVVLAVLDDDAAADKGRTYLRQFRRIKTLAPPDHDLTDYWAHGGDLRAWLAGRVAARMKHLLEGLDDQRHPELFATWLEIYTRAEDASGE
jgi:hypothetical protein